MLYLVKTPWWFKKLYANRLWSVPTAEKVLYLTFDDGPHETATPFALQQLKLFNAKASFFCIGKNVIAHPEIYQSILADGHTTANHTHTHVNGWKTPANEYLQNIQQASAHISSRLFRPPYGRITSFQAKLLHQNPAFHFKIVMWDVLSGDFDTTLAPEACLKNVTGNAGPGSIIVFHDSTKAYESMSYALPRVLEYYTGKGYIFKAL